jgi:hypothetical protein
VTNASAKTVLVPAIWPKEKGFRADAFPLEFRILAGTEADQQGEVVAIFAEGDRHLPRIAPLVVPCPGTNASQVRIEAFTFSPSIWDGRFILQRFEI